jgi:hypothetical protein
MPVIGHRDLIDAIKFSPGDRHVDGFRLRVKSIPDQLSNSGKGLGWTR